MSRGPVPLQSLPGKVHIKPAKTRGWCINLNSGMFALCRCQLHGINNPTDGIVLRQNTSGWHPNNAKIQADGVYVFSTYVMVMV
jgi:hypothetical protein